MTDGENGIPADHPVRVVREDPQREGLLYAGTEFGLYASFDDGAHWRPLQLDLPVTPVTDLKVKDDDLVVATQGRSYWILDDLGPLRQWRPAVAAEPAHLYTPDDVVLYPGSGGGSRGEGDNPPRGAVVYYHLADDLSADGADAGGDKDEVKIEILDADGEVLRTMSSQKEEPSAPNPFAQYFPERQTPRKLDAERGLDRWVWDLRLPDAHLVDDAVLWGTAEGPEVPPGSYQVRLTRGDGEPQVASFRVLQDPRLDVPPEDAAERFRLARQVHESISRAHRALDTLRRVRGQVAEVAKRVDPDGEDEALQQAAKALRETLDGIESRLTQPKAKAVQDVLNYPPQLDNQLLFLYGTVESATGRPTDASYQRFDELQGQLDGLLAELDAALGAELAAFEQQPAVAAAPPVVVGDTPWR